MNTTDILKEQKALIGIVTIVSQVLDNQDKYTTDNVLNALKCVSFRIEAIKKARGGDKE